MQAEFIAAAAVHVLFAVFWAGTTFAVARTDGALAAQFFRPQIGAAVIAFLSGGYLWKLTKAGALGQAGQLLSLGVLCAIFAAGIQGVVVGRLLRRMRSEPDDKGARRRVAIACRISAGLLVITVLTMASARFL